MHTNTTIIAKIQYQNSAMQKMGNCVDDDGTMQPSNFETLYTKIIKLSCNNIATLEIQH